MICLLTIGRFGLQAKPAAVKLTTKTTPKKLDNVYIPAVMCNI